MAAGNASGSNSRDSSAQARRRLREKVFGDVLPEVTSDEQETGPDGEATSDEWLRRQVPPHHG
ncbi:MAG: hypothetical protein HZY75_04120 [Nocardioidaceae bacterium]|nr:MAG: hypothetical protein HZY75_04120 [Nocardioidaceae bacterium]